MPCIEAQPDFGPDTNLDVPLERKLGTISLLLIAEIISGERRAAVQHGVEFRTDEANERMHF